MVDEFLQVNTLPVRDLQLGGGQPLGRVVNYVSLRTKCPMDEKLQTQIEPHTEAVLTSASDTPKVSKSIELVRKSAEYLDIVSAGKKLDPDDKNHIIKNT